MAEFMAINEENERIPRRVFRDRENPMDTLNDEQLILHYRFDRQSIHNLSDRLELDHSTFRSCALPGFLQLMIALRFYATGSFQSVIGEVFHVHKATVCRVIHRVSNALTRLLNTVVKFPSKQEEDEIAAHFFNVAGFPKVCGVIDGTHIRIQAPVQYEDQFVNRKGQHSINVQLVCNHENKITNVVAQWPGSRLPMTLGYLMRATLQESLRRGRIKASFLGIVAMDVLHG